MSDSAGGDLAEIVDGVYAWVQPDGSWFINNAGAVAGTDATVIIDTCATQSRTRRFLDAVTAATAGAPIGTAVNTHLHGDHTHGNCLLPAGTALIAHAETRAGIELDTVIGGAPPFWSPLPDWGAITQRLPNVTMTDQLVLHNGTRRIERHHPGFTAHTRGDVVAWLPQESVLYAGDLVFNGVTPLVFMGSLQGALRSLDWLAGFGAEHVVPGHGPLLTGAELEACLAVHERYYRYILSVAAQGQAAGQTPLEAARSAGLGEFAAMPDSERLVLNVHRAYADAQGLELDLGAAFADAVAYNGGPMHCAA